MEISEPEVLIAKEINDIVNLLNKRISQAINLGLKVTYDVQRLDITALGSPNKELLHFDVSVFKEIVG